MDDERKRAIFAELEKSGLLNGVRKTREPGDIDSDEMAAHLGVCARWGYEMIKKLARENPESYEMITVYDPEKKRRASVLRKKKQCI